MSAIAAVGGPIDPQQIQNEQKAASKQHELNEKIGIYTCEFFRQVATAIAGVIALSGAAVAGSIGSALAPIILLITGPLSMKVALGHLKESHQAVAKAQEKVDSAEGEARTEATQALQVAKWACGNQWMFLGMGVARITTCGMLTREVVKVLAGVSIKASIASAFVILHCVTSVIYALRGIILFGHAQKNLDIINEFAKNFDNAPDKVAFMLTATGKGDEYLGLRLDLKLWHEISKQDNPSEQETVEQFQKAIDSQRLKFTIARRSGALMMTGAILGAIALATGGAALPIIAAAVFAVAEVHFLLFYSSKLFEKYRDFGTKPEVPVINTPATSAENEAIVPEVPVAAKIPEPLDKGRSTCCPDPSILWRALVDKLSLRQKTAS